MQEFKILDEKKYPLPGLNKDTLTYYRWEHRATIGYRGRKFIAIVDNGVKLNGTQIEFPNSYIEEITSGQMEKIKDDNLWVALKNFIINSGFLTIQKPILKKTK